MITKSPGWSAGAHATTTSALQKAVEVAPERTFVDFSSDTTTYAEFHDLVMRLAHGLRSRGIGPGDTVVTILDNNVDAAASWFAANAVGAIAVPVNTAYKGEFLRHQIHDSRARIVLAEAEYIDRVLKVADGLPEVDELFVRGAWDANLVSGTGLRAGSLDELYAHDTSEKVPHFAVPRYVEFRDGLPKNPVGRVLKYQLRDEGCTDRTWDRSQADDLVVQR